MGNINNLSGKELISILKKLGFKVIRIKGSHHFLLHEDGRATTVPAHNNEIIGIGLMMKILKDVDISRNELQKLF